MRGKEKRANVSLLPLLALLSVVCLSGCYPSGEDSAPPAAPKAAPGHAEPGRDQRKSEAEAPEIARESARGPVKFKKDKAPASSDSDRRIAALPRETPPSGPQIEKLSGYKTPGEYFIIPSRNYPQGVVAVSLPVDYDQHTTKKYPLVIVFGGAGECARSPRQGALAWMHYYKTDEAIFALKNNHLGAADFRGLVTHAQLKDFNRKLKDRPYEGIILACPSSPLLSAQAGLEFPEYEAYIVDELIPALKRRYRVAAGRIGVDGVSMGGSRSMYYGFKYPELFSSVGSVQGAFGPYLPVYRQLLTRNKDVLKKRSIQLVTSDRDMMARSVESLHRMLLDHDIPHGYLKLTGPHDYVFNQGPGSLALLVFHDRALK